MRFVFGDRESPPAYIDYCVEFSGFASPVCRRISRTGARVRCATHVERKGSTPWSCVIREWVGEVFLKVYPSTSSFPPARNECSVAAHERFACEGVLVLFMHPLLPRCKHYVGMYSPRATSFFIWSNSRTSANPIRWTARSTVVLSSPSVRRAWVDAAVAYLYAASTAWV